MTKRGEDIHVMLLGKKERAELPDGSPWKVKWKVTRGKKLLHWCITQRSAISLGRDDARDARCELVIHGRDGKIRRKDSFGPDAYPPKG